jgi:hypothetical protein
LYVNQEKLFKMLDKQVIEERGWRSQGSCSGSRDVLKLK